MNTRNKTIILIITIFAISGCKKNSVEPLPSTNKNYIPINIGDVRQIVSLADSSTILMKVVGTRKRSDSTKVFEMEWTYGIQKPNTHYYLLKDGYFMSTNLTSDSDSVNPFKEQRLGKVTPVNSEMWKSIIGSSDSTFFIASYYKELNTLCGTFSNVYGFTLTQTVGGIIDTILTPYYAENIGYIGTDAQQMALRASYLKVANHEYGTLWPAKNVSSVGLSKRNVNNNILVQVITAYSLLGNKNFK